MISECGEIKTTYVYEKIKSLEDVLGILKDLSKEELAIFEESIRWSQDE